LAALFLVNDNNDMNNPAIRTLIFWIGGALLVAAAYRAYEWKGVALIVTGIFFWLMLHFTRLMAALKRAANRPIGHIGSAVMLNAKLKAGSSLLHVVALTKSLGALQSEKNVQPEVFAGRTTAIRMWIARLRVESWLTGSWSGQSRFSLLNGYLAE
jgi:hypothetical protein